jgi:hypothetical protein
MKKLFIVLIAVSFTIGCATRTKYVYVKPKTEETNDTRTGGPESGQGGEREKEEKIKKEEDETSEKDVGAKAPESPDTDKGDETSKATPENNRKLIGGILEEMGKEPSQKRAPTESPKRIEPVVSTVPRTVGSNLEPGELKINGIDTCNAAPVACVQIEAVCPEEEPGCRASGFQYVSVAGNAREYTVVAQGGGHTKLTCVSTAEVDDLYVKDLENEQRVRVVWMRRTNMCEPQVKECNSAAPRILDTMSSKDYVGGNRPSRRTRFACR